MREDNRSRYLLEKFTVGPMAVNCYVIADSATKKACIVDPGFDGARIKRFIEKEGYHTEFVINTHGHGDHIAFNGYFKCPVYIHRLDKDFLTDPDKNLSSQFFFKVKSPEASRLLEDGDMVELGEVGLKIIHTPGHTPGSVSIMLGEDILTGDTLFAGGIGRTDFEYGDEEVIFRSIRERLLTLSDDIVIHPGHGGISTIGGERKTNQFLI